MVLSTKVAAMLDDTKATVEVPEKKKRGRPKKEAYAFTWTPAQREMFQALSEEWFENPDSMDAWLTKSFLRQLPMLNELMMNPPPGRSGPMVILQSIKDIRELGIEALVMLEKRREKTKGADKKKS